MYEKTLSGLPLPQRCPPLYNVRRWLECVDKEGAKPLLPFYSTARSLMRLFQSRETIRCWVFGRRHCKDPKELRYLRPELQTPANNKKIGRRSSRKKSGIKHPASPPPTWSREQVTQKHEHIILWLFILSPSTQRRVVPPGAKQRKKASHHEREMKKGPPPTSARTDRKQARHSLECKATSFTRWKRVDEAATSNVR
jgi:hypothetical protein